MLIELYGICLFIGLQLLHPLLFSSSAAALICSSHCFLPRLITGICLYSVDCLTHILQYRYPDTFHLGKCHLFFCELSFFLFEGSCAEKIPCRSFPCSTAEDAWDGAQLPQLITLQGWRAWGWWCWGLAAEPWWETTECIFTPSCTPVALHVQLAATSLVDALHRTHEEYAQANNIGWWYSKDLNKTCVLYVDLSSVTEWIICSTWCLCSVISIKWDQWILLYLPWRTGKTWSDNVV